MSTQHQETASTLSTGQAAQMAPPLSAEASEDSLGQTAENQSESIEDQAPGKQLPSRGLRVWPAAIVALVQLGCFLLPTRLVENTVLEVMLLMWGPIISSVLLAAWILLASGLTVRNKLITVGVAVVSLAVVFLGVHPSVRQLVLIFAIPLAILSTVTYLLVTAWVPDRVRWVGLGILSLVVLGGWLLVRSNGATGGLNPELAWRWSLTEEEQYLRRLAERSELPADQRPEELLPAEIGDCPGFRGARRDGVVRALSIETDWAKQSPKQLWKQAIGPGWGSFAVVGPLAFTQEQRGKSEAVVCYHLKTGQEVWSHQEPTRFYEGASGAGPRATPCVANGQVYALGAEGTLCCLEAVSGKPIWKRDVAELADAKVPTWGFSGSPLVLGDSVVVSIGGTQGRALMAFQCLDGELLWGQGGDAKVGYSSPQLANLDGRQQILIFNSLGLSGLDPNSGKILWRSPWDYQDSGAITQPCVVDQSRVLIGRGYGGGCRLIRLSGGEPEILWETTRLKPKFNNGVTLDEHFYGFDGSILACVDLKTGARRWKGGRYGYGQLVLLAKQKLLLVLGEQGQVALVKATPERFSEVAQFQAIKGKTWNHPVVAHGKLLVRNSREVACYDLLVSPKKED